MAVSVFVEWLKSVHFNEIKARLAPMESHPHTQAHIFTNKKFGVH